MPPLHSALPERHFPGFQYTSSPFFCHSVFERAHRRKLPDIGGLTERPRLEKEGGFRYTKEALIPALIPGAESA
ncbi:hypothetical protein GCWU000341_02650 [Oribacterium sp. oral taxon 078 str. F0262]|nr:hypothetical protein GCWU000341_02650 [Oribacterium sp. oral taxon 078 str. F0262]